MIKFFVSCATGVEALLQEELASFLDAGLQNTAGGVWVEGTLEDAYRTCYLSRIASRVLWPLCQFEASHADALYDGVRQYPWHDEFPVNATLAIRTTLRQAPINHSGFVSQRIKDGIVDAFRDRFGRRPSIDRERPDILISCYWRKTQVSLYLDLGGGPLHERGYRQGGGPAPLKENLAAAMLMRLGWPRAGRFFDPMCGSGTLVIEAAEMALGRPAGRLRRRWGFHKWLGHVPALWRRIKEEANNHDCMTKDHVQIFAADQAPGAIHALTASAKALGIDDVMKIECCELKANHWQLDEGDVLVTNPPYGERMMARLEAMKLYGQLGDWLAEHCHNTLVSILTPDETMGRALGFRAERKFHFRNGPIPVLLWTFHVNTEARRSSAFSSAIAASDLPEELVNRLRKNDRKLRKWARKQEVSAYRLYDADLPNYACAIDVYDDCFHVQEYAPPKDIPIGKAQNRLQEVILSLRYLFDVPLEKIFLKQRRKQKSTEYGGDEERLGHEGKPFWVVEHGLLFEVELSRHLDTGLFLDHRPARRLIRELAKGKRFLNLFGYTGAATVYAAAGGAVATTTVDLSKTYLAWAQRNMRRNGFVGPSHEFVREDVLTWLTQVRGKWDLIFLDPPSFSTSKRMTQTWDVQRDHAKVIDHIMAHMLSDGGVLLFSTNLRKFKLEPEVTQKYRIQDLTSISFDPDFQQKQNHHRLYRIERG